jgi:predicted adenylyl cyclase CyaB
MLEIEAKIKVDSLDPIRRKLIELSAEKLETAKQTNIFFDRPDGSLRKADSGLRVRLEQFAESAEPKATITHKGPRLDTPLQPRESFDLVVTPAGDAVPFILALGFERTLTYEKSRESWFLDSCRVELDTLPHLGTFVEVEGPSEEAVEAVRRKLGLERVALVRESYVAMMARYVDEHEVPDRIVVFG